MKIEVRYDKDETKAIILESHNARFGDAPEGFEWVVEVIYCGQCEVRSRLIEPETTETTEQEGVAE